MSNNSNYIPPLMEIVEVDIELGYAGSQLPDRDPVEW